MLQIIGKIGHEALSPFKYFLGMLLRTYLVFKAFIMETRQNKRLPVRTTSFQVYFTGIQALPIIILSALILGTVVILELATILPSFGAGKYVERLSVIVMARELIPIMTALIIIGRSGTAMATELGNMKLNREIELLDSLGINIDYFIVFPRFIGTITATLCLTVIFMSVALAGGVIIGSFFAPPSKGLIFSQFLLAVNYEDVVIALIKAFCFGWVIAIVNCHLGLSVKKSFTEVPQVTTKGVVISIILCFVFSIFVSLYVFPSFNI